MNRTQILASLVIFESWFALSHGRADTFGSGVNSFQIEFVTIGNPGNAADLDDGDSYISGVQSFGSVPYEYRIGKFEISEGVVAKANMQGGLGITQSSRGANRPATFVDWNEAATFVNWLNTTSGSTPAYKFDAGGNLHLWQPSDVGYDPTNLFRNSRACYFLPSADEWYKAAYFDPTTRSYFDYPTASGMAPTPIASGTAANTAVFGLLRSQNPANVDFAGSLSPYGTMGQAGNVIEWEETDLDLVNDHPDALRGTRGGGWPSGVGELIASNRGGATIHSNYVIGFRVAAKIPEPNGLQLGAFASLGPLRRRRRHGQRCMRCADRSKAATPFGSLVVW
jgi:formylglycine-generating enzyme